MSYVLTDGELSVLQYPYNPYQLSADHPNTSFPSVMTDEDLSLWNVFPVSPTTPPTVDPLLQKYSEVNPVFNSETSTWVQTYLVQELTSEEIATVTSEYVSRSQQDALNLLKYAEQFMVEALLRNVGLSAEFVAYRAAILDYTNLPGYPNTQWPAFPSNPTDPALPLTLDAIYTKSETQDLVTATLVSSSTTAVQTFLSSDSTVYADSSPPPQASPVSDSGWYFKNAIAGQKSNWHFYVNASHQTYADISSLWAVVRLVSPASRPYVIIYSKPTGVNDAQPWYHSRWVWSAYDPATITSSGFYLIYMGSDPGVHPELPRLHITDQSASSQGERLPTEELLTFSWSTNSTSPVNAEEFVMKSVGHTIGSRTTVGTLVAPASSSVPSSDPTRTQVSVGSSLVSVQNDRYFRMDVHRNGMALTLQNLPTDTTKAYDLDLEVTYLAEAGTTGMSFGGILDWGVGFTLCSGVPSTLDVTTNWFVRIRILPALHRVYVLQAIPY